MSTNWEHDYLVSRGWSLADGRSSRKAYQHPLIPGRPTRANAVAIQRKLDEGRWHVARCDCGATDLMKVSLAQMHRAYVCRACLFGPLVKASIQ